MDKSHKKEIKHGACTGPLGVERAGSFGRLFSPQKGALLVETITDKITVVSFALIEDYPIVQKEVSPMTHEDRCASPTHGHVGDYDVDGETNNLKRCFKAICFWL